MIVNVAQLERSKNKYYILSYMYIYIYIYIDVSYRIIKRMQQ